MRKLLGLVLLLPALCLAGPMMVIYPRMLSADDHHLDDSIALLYEALERTVPEYGPYVLKPSSEPMNEARYLQELRSGKAITIALSSTSVEKERDFLVVRIPLDKGLLSYRISLISKSAVNRINQVKTLDDLKKLTIGQGVGWGDVKVYQANGLNVVTNEYPALFPMVAASRFDLFPRGVNEYRGEFEQHVKANPNLAIDQHLLLYYPWPYYFFFNKSSPALRNRVEAGLRKMIRDGSFDKIFAQFHRDDIEKAHLRDRTIIRLKNPLLPKETPLNDPTLWLDPRK